jgi:hypothetical protein
VFQKSAESLQGALYDESVPASQRDRSEMAVGVDESPAFCDVYGLVWVMASQGRRLTLEISVAGTRVDSLASDPSS